VRGALPELEFVPFTEADFDRWLAEAIPAYAVGHVQDGQWTLAESLDKSREAHFALLPQGLATPGHTFMRLRVRGEADDVGFLWWQDVEAAGQPGVYVYGVEVAEHARRRGIASAAFLELERVSRATGQRFVALHVFGHNLGARALYQELGFVPTNLTMRKNL